MPKIPEIGVSQVGVSAISVDQPIPPPVLPVAPPVTARQLPIIDMPGCVRARIASGNGTESYEEDPRGNVTLCSGAVPVYEAPDYRPRDFTRPELPRAPIKKPDSPSPAQDAPLQSPGTKPGSLSVNIENTPCPPFGAQAIGTFNKLSTKILAGYEIRDGQCIKSWASLPVPQVFNNYLPDAGPTTSIALTAAFATTVAIFAKPIASILQKLAKPLTKKVVKKINQKLGRKVKLESLKERRAAQHHRNSAIRDLRRALGK